MYPILLAFLAAQPGGFCASWFVQNVVPMRRPIAYTLFMTALADAVWLTGIGILKSTNSYLFVIALPVIGFLGVLLYGDPAHRMRTALVQMIFWCVPTILSMAVGVVLLPAVERAGGQLSDFTEVQGKYYVYISLLLNIIIVFVLWGLSEFLSRLLRPVREQSNLFWLISVPMSQIALLTLYADSFFQRGAYYGEYPAFVVAAILCIAADAACIFGYRRYRVMEMATIKLREAESQMQLQAEHYRNLQEDILTVNQIRHDLKNQLQAACYLLEQGNAREVREQLDLIDLRLSEKVGSRYCENLMVDAVLTDKARLCREKGIRFQVSALVPEQIAMENAYLCSAFSNLLDNAIAGTLKSDSPAGPIDLSCDIQGDYLRITCKNPGRQQEKKRKTDLLREHGLGLGILEKIAEMGEGSFHLDQENGSFRAVLILRK